MKVPENAMAMVSSLATTNGEGLTSTSILVWIGFAPARCYSRDDGLCHDIMNPLTMRNSVHSFPCRN